jgi:hypothetical protein
VTFVLKNAPRLLTALRISFMKHLNSVVVKSLGGLAIFGTIILANTNAFAVECGSRPGFVANADHMISDGNLDSDGNCYYLRPTIWVDGKSLEITAESAQGFCNLHHQSLVSADEGDAQGRTDLLANLYDNGASFRVIRGTNPVFSEVCGDSAP